MRQSENCANSNEFSHIDPKLNEPIMAIVLARTLECGNIQRKAVIRGEMPIEFRDSWFTTKTMN